MTAGWWVAVALIGGLALVLLVNHYGVKARRLRQVPPSDCRDYGATSRRPVVSAHEGFSPDSLHPLDHAEGGHSRG